jgi:hypothetical protein
MSSSPPQQPWQQVSELIQPALIRLLDQLRKQLETSPWQGRYETVELWPEGVDPAATPPQVLYLLHLTQGEKQIRVNLWELCFQICFCDYTPCLEQSGITDFQVGEVTTDSSLFTADGEIDWHRLDQKAQQGVAQVFRELPLD